LTSALRVAVSAWVISLLQGYLKYEALVYRQRLVLIGIKERK